MTTDCENCPLRRRPAFQPMTRKGVEFMGRFKTGELEAQPGTQIMAEGASSTHLFTCLSGQGLRYKTLTTGERQVIGFVQPGDFVGLQAGVMGEMKHSVEATTPMRLCTFNRSALWNLFENRPERAFDLTHLAATEEHFMGEALAIVGQLDAPARISWALYRFYQGLSAVGMARKGEVPLPYRQQDLADATGLSLVHTNKTLSKLRKDKVASWTDGKLVVHNIDKLRVMGNASEFDFSNRPLI